MRRWDIPYFSAVPYSHTKSNRDHNLPSRDTGIPTVCTAEQLKCKLCDCAQRAACCGCEVRVEAGCTNFVSVLGYRGGAPVPAAREGSGSQGESPGVCERAIQQR